MRTALQPLAASCAVVPVSHGPACQRVGGGSCGAREAAAERSSGAAGSPPPSLRPRPSLHPNPVAPRSMPSVTSCPLSLNGGSCKCPGSGCHRICLRLQGHAPPAAEGGSGVVDAMIPLHDPHRLPSRPRAARPLAPPHCSPPEQFPSTEMRGGSTVLRRSPPLSAMPRQARHIGAAWGEKLPLAGLHLRRDKCASPLLSPPTPLCPAPTF